MSTQERWEFEADDIFEKECGALVRNDYTSLERVRLKLWHRYGYLAAYKKMQEEAEGLTENSTRTKRVRIVIYDGESGWVMDTLSRSLPDGTRDCSNKGNRNSITVLTISHPLDVMREIEKVLTTGGGWI